MVCTRIRLTWAASNSGVPQSFSGSAAGTPGDVPLQTDRLSVEFKVLRETQELQVILWGLDAGHQVVWEMPLDDVPAEAPVGCARFIRAAEERDEVGFARRHKRRFLLQQWERSVDMFSKLSH